MRILFTIKACGHLGGMETVLRAVGPALKARGHQVALLCERRLTPQGPGNPDPFTACDAVWCVQEVGSRVAWAAARDWGADVVGINTMTSAAGEARAASLGPAVFFAHNLDSVCPVGTRLQWRHGPHLCGQAAGIACLGTGVTQGCGARNPLRAIALQRNQSRRKSNFARYRRVVVFSQFMGRELLRAGVAERQLRCLHFSPLRTSLPAPVSRSHAPDRVLCLARLVRSKGVALLLQALAEAERRLGRKLYLTHAGAGPMAEEARRLAESLHLAVTWRGWVSENEVVDLISTADLLAVPSLLPEPFGIVGREAQLAGLPAVGFGHGGIPEWLRGGVNGEEAMPQHLTSTELASALVRALDSRDHLETLRRGAWESAQAFDPSAFLDQLEAVLYEAADPGPEPSRRNRTKTEPLGSR